MDLKNLVVEWLEPVCMRKKIEEWPGTVLCQLEYSITRVRAFKLGTLRHFISRDIKIARI